MRFTAGAKPTLQRHGRESTSGKKLVSACDAIRQEESRVYRYRRILVGLTLAERDQTTIRYAAMVSKMAASKTVHFIHVASRPEIPREIRDAYPEMLPPEDEVTEDRMVDLVRQHFDGNPDPRLIHDVVEGSPVTEILEVVRRNKIDLILVGKTAGHQNSGLLPEKLARKAPCSVCVVPEGTAAKISNLLVAADFSDNSADAMEAAIAFARAVPLSSMTCLHAYWLPKVMHPAADCTDNRFHALLRRCAENRYREFISDFDLEGLSVIPLLQMEKRAANAVVRAVQTRQADLVVVGARGRTAAAAVLLGSVTERLISSTAVPLLAVKKKGTGLGFLEALLLKT